MKKTLLLACLALLGALPLPAAMPVQGRILAPDGRGIAGVRVELRPVLQLYERGLRELQAIAEPEAAARTVSGPEGEFLLTAPKVGVWQVLLRAEGFVALRSHPFLVADDVHLGPVEMRPDSGLRVRIAGSDGAPLAGARVRALPGAGWNQGWQPEERTGVSGPDGTLRLSRTAGEALRLWLLAPGYPVQEHAASVDGAVLKLERGTPGRLWVSRSGKSVAGALVREAQSGFLLGQTDESGLLGFEAPKSGTWEARIEPRDSRATVFPVRNPLHKTVNLALPLPLRIEGRVLDRHTAEPLAGAWVWTQDDPAALARTDAAGTYRLDGQTPGWVWLLAASPGYFWNNASYLVPELVPEKGASRSAPALALAASGTLAGTVVDEDGRPLAGVRIRGLAGGDGTELFRTSTSAQGRFRVSQLGEGSYALILSRPGFAAERQNVSLAPGEKRDDLRFLLRPGRAAAGLLVDEAGEPVAGAEVELVRSVTAAPAVDDEALAEDRWFRSTSGSDGRFRLGDLPAGWFELNIRRRGFQPLREKALELSREADVQDLGTFVLKRGAALEGRVRDPSGAPLADAEIWVAAEAGSPAARTGSDGSFRIEGLDPEEGVALEICRRGHLTAGLSLEALPAEPVEVTLPLAARLSGRVVTVDGEPLPAAQVRAALEGEEGGSGSYSPMSSTSSPCPQNSDLAEASTGPDGGFILESLKPGRFHLTATAPGYLSATRSGVEVRPDAENRAPDLALERGAVLVGRVLAPDGSPVAGAAVRAAGKRSHPRGFTDGDGNYRLDGVEPGKVRAEALHEEQGHASEETVILPGENRLDLRLAEHPRREVRGRVTGPDGRPVEGALIETREDPFNYGTTYSGADGGFVIGIGERDIALWAFQEGLSPGRAAIPAGGTAPQNLEIRLERSASITGRLLGLDAAELRRATVSATHESFLERQGTVDREGRFRLADVAPGNWTLAAEAGGRKVEVQVAVATGEEVVVDLALPPAVEEKEGVEP